MILFTRIDFRKEDVQILTSSSLISFYYQCILDLDHCLGRLLSEESCLQVSPLVLLRPFGGTCDKVQMSFRTAGEAYDDFVIILRDNKSHRYFELVQNSSDEAVNL